MPVLLLVAVGSAIDLTTFRTSRARVTSSDLFFSGSSNLGSFQTAETAGRWLYADIAPSWSWFSSTISDRQYLRLDQNLGLGAGHDRITTGSESREYDYLQASETFSEDWNQYLGQTGFFAGLSSMLYPWTHLELRPDTGLVRVESGIYGDALLGVGYGHMRDAWPLAKAIRLLGILRDNDLIADEPRQGGVQAVADFISRSWRLFYVHDRSARFYYDSLEAVLFANGIIRHELPAYVLMKLDDNLMLGSDTREFGSRFFVGGILGYMGAIDYWRHPGGTPTGRWSTTWAYVHPDLEYHFARPFGMRWTTDAEITDEIRYPGDTLRHTIFLGLNCAYEITNRLRAYAGFNLNGLVRHAYRSLGTPLFTGHGGPSAGFDYYVSNRLVLKAGADYYHRYIAPGDTVSFPRSLLRLSLSISVGPQWRSSPVRGFESQ